MQKKGAHLANNLLIETYAAELALRKVSTWDQTEGCWRSIPAALSPTLVRERDWSALEVDAHLILNAFPKIMAWILKIAEKSGEARNFLNKMLGDLSPYEAAIARSSGEYQWGHATMRLDLFWHLGQIKIIEANCTIPAMQAYSDNVLSAWLAAGGDAPSRESNIEQLLKSLLALYRRNGGQSVRPRIAVLHRPGDSQRGELEWLADVWTKAGYETTLVTPDDLGRSGDLWMVANQPYEVVYRHIFASKIQNEIILEALKNPQVNQIYNPVSAHYECKAFFAVLSHVAADPDLCVEASLTREEALAIERRLPWSRVIGGPICSVSVENVERRLEGVVVKRSVGYGGHHVLMGDQWFSTDNQRRLEELTGLPTPIDFKAFASWMEREGSLWVAQERLSGARRQTQVLTVRGVETWNAWYDASIFLNTSGVPIARGGVSRIAEGPVVNIGTGGGLAPFVLQP